MRILHFSDFHLAKDGIEQSSHLVDRMLDCLRPLNRQRQFDLILFTGDLVDKGGSSFDSPQEAYNTFRKIVIRRICSGLNIPESSFYVCPGNHEVNRNLTVRQKDYKLEHGLNSAETINQYLISDRNPGFGERLHDYDEHFRKEWLQEVSQQHYTSVRLADHFIIEADGRKVGISCLNSAWRCGKKTIRQEMPQPGMSFCKKIKNLFSRPQTAGTTPEYQYVESDIKGDENNTYIGASQITEAISFFRNHGTMAKLALAHHHFSMLGQAERNSLDNILRKNYDLCFFGHTHTGGADRHQNPKGEMICTTAPGVIRWDAYAEDKYKNGFAVWDVDFAKGIAIQYNYLQHDGGDFTPDRDFTPDGRYEWILGQEGMIVPLRDIIGKILDGVHLDSEDLQKIRNHIIECEDDMIVYGVPGVGKTHLLAQTYDEVCRQNPQLKVLYCRAGKMFEQIQRKLTKIFTEHTDGDTILIFDNCDIVSLREVLNLRDEYHSRVRVIGAMNQYDSERLRFNTLPIVDLRPADNMSAISEYVDTRIQDFQLRETVKRYADGFPQIAIKLVEQAMTGNGRVRGDANMLRKLFDSFGEEVRESDGMEEMLEVMSLFQPFPKLEDDSMAIWGMKSLSSLHTKSREEIVALIELAKKIWHGALLESSPSGYSVRPFILAVHLAERWMERNAANGGLESLLAEIAGLPQHLQSPVMAALSARMSHLGASPESRRFFTGLTDVNGVFRCENVVFSEMGSRLILAISDVNPAELGAAIRSVLESADTKEIQGIGYMTRRNLVSAMRRLAFYPEGFEDAMYLLAVMATNETEHSISNNATGSLQEIFHILLPGTKATLLQRMDWLERYSSDYECVRGLLHVALRGVFAVGHFMRMGDVGPENRRSEDYAPTYAEIKEYWQRGSALAERDIREGRNIGAYTSIVADNIHLWTRSGMLAWAMPLISAVTSSDTGGLKLLENDFRYITDTLKAGGDATLLGDWMALEQRIVADDIVSRLMSLQHDYYDKHHSGLDTEEEIAHFIPMARDFVKSGEFASPEIWDAILRDHKVLLWPFCAALERILSDKELSELFEAIIASNACCDTLVSPFLLTFCSMTRKHEAAKAFVKEIYDKGYRTLHVRLMARMEDDDLTSMTALENLYASTDFNFMPVYLENVSMTVTSRPKLMAILASRLNVAKREIIGFVVTHCQFGNFAEDELSDCRHILSETELEDLQGNLLMEYKSLCIKILKMEHNDNFARNVIAKFLGAPYELYDTYAYTSLFKYLLDNYRDVTLPLLLDTMTSAESLLSVGRRLMSDLGSGFGFGKGDFFTLDENMLLKILDKGGLKMARAYAEMCPVFDDGEENQFSEWIRLLLDRYGDDAEVRDNISCNMGSYQWGGSIIPLLDKKIRCFTSLLGHPKAEVREWAQGHIKYLRDARSNEIVSDDFRQHLC